MTDEFELVEHSEIAFVKAFLVQMNYRTPHLHSDFEFCVVLAGAVHVLTRGKNVLCNSGTLLLFNPNQPHEIRAARRSALILSLQISSRFCEAYFPQLKNTEFESPTPCAGAGERMLRALLVKIAQQYFQREDGYELSLFSLVNLLFCSLLRTSVFRVRSEEERQQERERAKRLRRILETIDSRYTGKLLLSEIAQAEHLSLTYLSHFFKDNFNMTFQQYVGSLRLEKARRLLLESDETLLDICLACGFSDGKYLNRRFVERYGCTPREYRKSRHAPVSAADPPVDPPTVQHFISDTESLALLKQLAEADLHAFNDESIGELLH